MKKVSILSLVFLFVFMITGCGKQEMYFVSEPVGYALISDTYVAKASFDYYSKEPYNVNNIAMELYYLPSVWGEIEMGINQQVSVEDPNILIMDYDTLNQKIYAKHILIGTTIWTAEIDNNKVKYVNGNGVDILELLLNEQEAKLYVENLESRSSNFMQPDGGFLFDYHSKLDPTGTGIVYKSTPTEELVVITWGETLSSFPDLSSYYPDFDSSSINALFHRVYAKSEAEETLIKERTYEK